MTTEEGATPTSVGKHDRATWVGLLCTVLRDGRSGSLQVSFARSWRRFDMVLGIPVDYQSDRDEDPIARALADAAPDSRADHLREALAQSLEWATGQWRFTPAPAIDPESVDPALLPEPVTLSGLWAGVKQHLAMDEAMPVVTSVEVFEPATDFEDWFSLLGVEAPFDELPAALADGCGTDVLYRRLPDRSGNLVKLLWLLHQAALFVGQLDHRGEMASMLEGLRAGDSTETELEEEPASLPSSPGTGEQAFALAAGSEEASLADEPASKAEGPSVADAPEPTEAGDVPAPPRRTRDPATVIKRDYDQRMRKDYYTFLGIESDAPKPVIEKRARQLAARWQAAMRHKAVPMEAKELAKELATGAQLVYRTLADPKRRAEYDRRAAAGQAPLLRPIKGATGLSSPASRVPQRPEPETARIDASGDAPTMLERIQHFIDGKEWKLAASLLEEARLVNPSDPDVLAHLGWVTWILERDQEAAEEFLQLAVAFDRNHLNAISYLGKLALEVGDEDRAHKWLTRVMELDRTQRWARRALRKLPAREADQGQKGLRFWGRKGE